MLTSSSTVKGVSTATLGSFLAYFFCIPTNTASEIPNHRRTNNFYDIYYSSRNPLSQFVMKPEQKTTYKNGKERT